MDKNGSCDIIKERENSGGTIMKYGNLHLHSSQSDGGFRPAHLVRLAKALGYGAVALTDHETLTGIPELFATAKVEGIEAMSGVEFCTKYKGEEIHVTGLDFDPNHPAIVEFSKMVGAGYSERTRTQYEDMIERGCIPNFTWEEMIRYCPRTDFYCIDHIVHALDAAGISPYAEQDKIRIAYRQCDPSKLHFVRPSADDTIKAIRDAGGVAIIAHPHAALFEKGIIEDYLEKGANGIEINHSELSEQETKLAIHAAMKYNLYCSGGTDHTGAMSACGGSYAIPVYHGVTEDEYRAIKERRFG